MKDIGGEQVYYESNHGQGVRRGLPSGGIKAIGREEGHAATREGHSGLGLTIAATSLAASVAALATLAGVQVWCCHPCQAPPRQKEHC